MAEADSLSGEESNRPGSQKQSPQTPEAPTWAPSSEDQRNEIARDLIKSRYDYILRQIQIVDENVYRFLAIYQTLMTVLVGAQILLFVNHRRWSLSASTTKIGLIGILALETIIASFAALMIIIGVLNWLDYRTEECDISDAVFGNGFRQRPTISNWYRWYETYILAFILMSLGAIWLLVYAFAIPRS